MARGGDRKEYLVEEQEKGKEKEVELRLQNIMNLKLVEEMKGIRKKMAKVGIKLMEF